MSQKNDKDKSDEIKKYFESLRLKDWKFCGNLGKNNTTGQASVFEVENITNGERGVFRVLKKKEDERENNIEVRRFYRELEILTNKEMRHSNIVSILDYTKDSENHWYISKKGDNFKNYWNDFVEQHKDKADDIALEAVRIIKLLSDGLSKLHEKDVIHRDIKFSNIVMDGNNPVLIDFGISFVLGEERLSDIPISNMLGIDPTSSLGDKVLPWIDIFLLSQLLIKMLADDSSKQKNIQGPRDWRWVKYIGVSNSYRLRIMAIVSSCSNIVVSPKNAIEFKLMIEHLFDSKEVSGTEDFIDNMKSIDEILKNNKASSILKANDNFSLAESRLNTFLYFSDKFKEGILSVGDKLKGSVFDVGFEIEDDYNKSFKDSFYNDVSKSAGTYTGKGSYVYIESNGFKIMCEIGSILNTTDSMGDIFKNTPFLRFKIYDNNRNKFYKQFNMIYKIDGSIDVYNDCWELIRNDSSLKRELDLIYEQLVDEDMWKEISM